MADFTITATDWTYDSDLDAAAVFAGQYRARYEKLTGGYWDDAYFVDIAPYHGEALPDLVTINVTVDGITEDLVKGVVDTHSAQHDATGVVAELSGRDLIALMLDRYPEEPRTFAGIASDGTTVETNDTFLEVAAHIAEVAGLALVTRCHDYPLGRDVVVGTDRTLAEVLAELLRPLRASRKHRVDAWVQGGTLYLARRQEAFRGIVELPKERIYEVRVEKTRPVLADEIRVEGATYESLTAAPSAAEVRTSSNETITDQGGQRTVVTELLTEYLDDAGRLYRRMKRVTHFRSRPSASTYRQESHVMEATFWGDGEAVAIRGKRRSEVETVYVDYDLLTGASIGAKSRRTERAWTYHDDGSTDTETVTDTTYNEQRADEETERRVTTYVYRTAGGQVLRTVSTVETDPTDGTVRRTQSQAELGPVASALGPQETPAGTVRETLRFADGPAGARLTATFDLLGSVEACEDVRADLLDENPQTEIRLEARIMPDLRVKVGKRLSIPDAPSWWGATAFYVTAVRFAASGDHVEQTVEALAWAG